MCVCVVSAHGEHTPMNTFSWFTFVLFVLCEDTWWTNFTFVCRECVHDEHVSHFYAVNTACERWTLLVNVTWTLYYILSLIKKLDVIQWKRIKILILIPIFIYGGVCILLNRSQQRDQRIPLDTKTQNIEIFILLF